MILSLEIGADVVIIDDANAKKYARYLGLPVTGTLGVLMRAKQKGYIGELKPILQCMTEKEIYISQNLRPIYDQIYREHVQKIKATGGQVSLLSLF